MCTADYRKSLREYRHTPLVVGRVVGRAYVWISVLWKVAGQRSGELAAPVHLKIGGRELAAPVHLKIAGLFAAFFGELLGSS